MAVHNLEITTVNLLNIVAAMPENEFNNFVETAKKLRTKQRSHRVLSRESDLLLSINTLFSADEKEKYNLLYAKFERDEITQSEHQKLLALSDKFEVLNAKRLEYLGELAKIRRQTLTTVIQDLGIKPAQ